MLLKVDLEYSRTYLTVFYLGKFRESFPAAFLDQGLEPNTCVLQAQAQRSELELKSAENQ